MSLFILSAKAEIHLSFEGKDLIVHSDQEGVEGFKGCTTDKLKKIPAYTFRLFKNQIPNRSPICKAPHGKWKQVKEQTSNDGTALFKGLADGEYKVICLVGKAIGCEIDGVPNGYPSRSIVYEQEQSQKAFLGVTKRNRVEEQRQLTSNAGLLVFPNPATKEINIQLTDTAMKEEITISIYDLLGKQVYTKDVVTKNSEETWKVNTTAYSSGTYMVKIVDENGKSAEGKFVVIHK